MEIKDKSDAITVSMADFEDIKWYYEDYCDYYRTYAKLCPLMEKDINRNIGEESWIAKSFSMDICIYACKWYRRMDIPSLLKLR